MAELALGAIEVAIRPRTRPEGCHHDNALTITACGVERSICETCGHISVSFVSEVAGPVTRGHFARPADDVELDDPVDTYSPFADSPHLDIRRREPADRGSLLLLLSA